MKRIPEGAKCRLYFFIIIFYLAFNMSCLLHPVSGVTEKNKMKKNNYVNKKNRLPVRQADIRK